MSNNHGILIKLVAVEGLSSDLLLGMPWQLASKVKIESDDERPG